jgi:hypothetical protein
VHGAYDEALSRAVRSEAAHAEAAPWRELRGGRPAAKAKRGGLENRCPPVWGTVGSNPTPSVTTVRRGGRDFYDSRQLMATRPSTLPQSLPISSHCRRCEHCRRDGGRFGPGGQGVCCDGVVTPLHCGRLVPFQSGIDQPGAGAPSASAAGVGAKSRAIWTLSLERSISGTISSTSVIGSSVGSRTAMTAIARIE